MGGIETHTFEGTCMRCGKKERSKDSYKWIICRSCKKSDAYVSESALSEQMVELQCGEE